MCQQACAREDHFPSIQNTDLKDKLNALQELRSQLSESPYDIELHTKIAEAYTQVGYPDLAVGAAYKALLLIDIVNDEDAELYEEAFEGLISSGTGEASNQGTALNEEPESSTKSSPEAEALARVNGDISLRVYVQLAQCLHACKCERSAAEYISRGLELFPDDESLLTLRQKIYASAAGHSANESVENLIDRLDKLRLDQLRDEGFVRRECYPWNTFEPDRCSSESLAFLNAEMQKVAPKLEVRATELPALSSESGDSSRTVLQLGVFAKEDLSPGDVILEETSLLTANNRLQDALCDACSADLPEMTDPAFSEVVACPECSVVFCNQRCFDLADEQYHPAICDRGVEDIAKNAPPTEAANALYTLLLLRAVAMAETQQCHPLDLSYVKFIWGDYHTMDLSSNWTNSTDPSAGTSPYPQTLPFSFHANVVLPFTMLEMMDVDIFKNTQYDVWVFNTLYAKFRGTASARLSGLGGRPVRGPEVSAVHPMWCLANHSCDPNVTWRWASDVRFSVLENRVVWKAPNGSQTRQTQPGIAADEEIMNHYCDIDLPVDQRREWAAGSLGGLCCCDRCRWEAQ